MRANGTRHKDQRWDLTLEIASKLWYYGEYVIHMIRESDQQMVDVHWAALQAGRLLGVRARVTVTGPSSSFDPMVTVTVGFDDVDGRVRARAEQGFERLLRSVRAHDH